MGCQTGNGVPDRWGSSQGKIPDNGWGSRQGWGSSYGMGYQTQVGFQTGMVWFQTLMVWFQTYDGIPDAGGVPDMVRGARS